MKPSALLLNDIHCGIEYLSEFEANWKEALDVCTENGICRIILGGDLFQSRASQSIPILKAIQKFLYEVKRNNILITIIPGNHDKQDSEDTFSYCHIFRDIDNVAVVDEYCKINISDSVFLHCLPYFPENGSALRRIESIDVVEGALNILYCHQGIRGGLSKASDDELPTSIFEKFSQVLVGHYHDRNTIEGTNIQYIGASRQATYGENEEKGYTILYDNGETEFVKNEVNTRYVTFKSSSTGASQIVASNQRVFNDNRYRKRLQLIVGNNEPVDKEKYLEMGFSKVEVIQPDIEANEHTQVSLTEKFDKDSIVANYIEFCKDENLSPDLGLSYLTKKIVHYDSF